MASEILRRNPTSTGNRRVFTWAGWVKINKLSALENCIWYTASSGNSEFNISLVSSTGALNVYDYAPSAYQYQYATSRLLRDFSNWFHLVVAVDTTQVREDDRFKIYINGSLYNGSYSTEVTAGGINYNTRMNTPGEINYIGQNINGGSAYDANCELTDMFMIDGQALTPDVFGFYKVGKGYVSAGSAQSTDFRPGQWVPKTPRVIKTAINNSGGFGVNGFYLPMNDSNNFGADFHCEPNSIIKLQENLPQPRSRIDGVGDYTGALRDDPFKQYLVLALPFVSGGLQSGFGDYSAAIKGSGSAKTVTVNGSLATSNTVSLYYGSSAFLNNGGASGSQFLNTSHSDYALGLQNFTIECWIYPTSLYNYWTLLSTRPSDGAFGDAYHIGTDSAGSTGFYSNEYDAKSSNGVINVNQWSHIAAVRTGSTLTLYLNGVAVAVNTNYTKNLTRSDLTIGRLQNLGTNLESATGYLQDLRIYKGVAKYKGGFDVPRPYTPVGIATWRAVPDSPANNFATLNAVQVNRPTLTDGNLSWSAGASYSYGQGTVSIPTTGKWVFEGRFNTNTTTSNYNSIGVGIANPTAVPFGGSSGTGTYGINDASATFGQSFVQNGGRQGSITLPAGTIIQVLVDRDNNKINFVKDGTLQTETGSTITIPSGVDLYAMIGEYSVSGQTNFGQNPTFSGNTTAGTYTDSNNKGLFKYQPPSGFLALCEDNLPTPAISDPGKYFKTVLYTGDGGSRNIVGVGFTPDLVWIKSRTNGGYYHNLVDSVRGPSRRLASNSTNAEDDASAGGATPILGSFDYDGFSLPNGNVNVNESGQNYVAWCWKAGAGTTSTNTNGSITSVVSVNQDAGFSIVSYTGNGSAGATVGHGLGITPAMVIIKSRNEVRSWIVFHRGASPTPNPLSSTTFALGSLSSGCLSLNLANGTFAYTMDGQTNVNGNTYIAYCWAEIEGFSKFGSYTGNGSADGPFVYCGFKPAWVMIKRTDSTGDWYLFDSSRNSSNPVSLGLLSNTTQIDGDYTGWGDFLSNGFKIRRTDGAWNASGGTYIFVAFAESPFQTANAK